MITFSFLDFVEIVVLASFVSFVAFVSSFGIDCLSAFYTIMQFVATDLASACE